MIYQVLASFEEKLKDSQVGINARIDAVNTAYETELPRVQEVLVWDQSKLPSAFPENTLLVVWEGGQDVDLIHQGKWNTGWMISLQWFQRERNGTFGAKNAALVASALRSFIDYMSEVEDPQILEIMDVTIQVAGWVDGQQLFRWVSFNFRVKERDEDAIIVSDP